MGEAGARGDVVHLHHFERLDFLKRLAPGHFPMRMRKDVMRGEYGYSAVRQNAHVMVMFPVLEHGLTAFQGQSVHNFLP